MTKLTSLITVAFTGAIPAGALAATILTQWLVKVGQPPMLPGFSVMAGRERRRRALKNCPSGDRPIA